MPVTINTSAVYYSSEDLHGNYQYITLEDIVNNFIMSGDDDDYTSNVDRYKVLFQARRAFRELYFDAIQEIKGIALELSPTLSITLPPDFVNLVRMSWIDDDGLLRPMASNDKMDISKEYLQDHLYNILFDENGCPLVGYDEPLAVDEDTGEASVSDVISSWQFNSPQVFQPNKNFTHVYGNGSYKIDKNNGLIKFGSEIYGKSVVLEYISDGLYTGCEGSDEDELKIHKFAEDSVYNWIYWKLIERRRNVPANAKVLARKDWFNSRRICKRRINTINANDLRQVFKGSNRWIKGI